MKYFYLFFSNLLLLSLIFGGDIGNNTTIQVKNTYQTFQFSPERYIQNGVSYEVPMVEAIQIIPFER
uniref:Uncharacterized protein n=1 Tax=Strongyloides venezuelensis TaxID=75913 RepID=A0A0K0G5H1_STRVS